MSIPMFARTAASSSKYLPQTTLDFTLLRDSVRQDKGMLGAEGYFRASFVPGSPLFCT
jgi:hypothetical protein